MARISFLHEPFLLVLKMMSEHDDDGQLQSQASLRALLDRLPQEQVCHAFAYGSGVFSQQQQQQQRPPEEGRTTSTTTTQSDALDRAKDDDEDPTNHDEASKTSPPPPLVDIIVVVREARAFHYVNRRINPSHYPASTFSWWWSSSSSSSSSSSADTDAAVDWATWVQCHTLPDYLHPYLHNPQLYFLLTNDGFKYGVVQLDHLLDDLHHWRYLYLAGRLHKPTVTISTGNYGEDNRNDDNDDAATAARIVVEEAQQSTNLPNALVTALALWQEEDYDDGDGAVAAVADDVNVFTTIASLSYTGDPRVRWGAEDPHKVQSLVLGGHNNGKHRHYHLDRWRRLYEPAMRSLEQRGLLSITTTTTPQQQQQHDDQQRWRLEWDREGVRRHLPRALLLRQHEDNNRHSTTTASTPPPPLVIRDRLRSIVAPAARYQSLKGLLTVRPQRAWDYLIRKLAKGQRRGRRPLF